MEKKRFTLLILDPGEIYFEDFSVYMFRKGVSIENFDRVKQDGRLKMCSKSIVFDPKDIMKPMIKIPLKDCQKIIEWRNDDLFLRLKLTNVISIKCTQYIELLQGNNLAPYIFKQEQETFSFELNYALADDILPQICQLHRASTLPVVEQNIMISTIAFSRQSRVTFDTLWLDDLYEKTILETQGSKITPLVVNPGRILLTTSRIYFQPYNNIETMPVIKIHLKDIKRITKRRFLLKHVGLELFYQSLNQDHFLYLTLKTQEDRDNLYQKLIDQPGLKLDNICQDMMTLQWQNGVISNYDYLHYINSLADRTFNDLTQYPVFPWVINDYTSSVLQLDNPKIYRDLSQPIGALNPARLKRLKDRYDEMSPPKFLYGSHYSTPGFVLFYLVRKYPHYLLCLHNGRFDHPDRMFNSIPDVWNNVQTNMADFKELIPEFYNTDQGGDFCSNAFGIQLGFRADGSKVDDVKLPEWAKDPADFVNQLRAALESDFVSKNLHHWIDLIFGYKQRGPEAEKANNVFYYLCYEGAVDLNTFRHPADQHALEVQIMEFGQIPKQVFHLPHPQRITIDIARPLSALNISECQENKLQNTKMRSCCGCEFDAHLVSHKDRINGLAFSATGQMIVSCGHDTLVKMFSLGPERRQTRSISLSTMPLSAVVLLSDEKTLLVGSWNNHITIYDVEFGRITDSVPAHEDAVSCLAWAEDSQILASGSWDCSIRLWQGFASGRKIKLAKALLAQLDHDSRITCLAISCDNNCVVSGTQDGQIFLWSLQSYDLVRTLPGHSGPVTCISFSQDNSRLVSSGDDRAFKVFDMNTSMQVYSKSLEHQLRSLAWNGLTLIIGDNEGSLFLWDLVHVELIKKLQAHQGEVSAIAVSKDNKLIITAGGDHKVILWKSLFK